MDKYSKEFKLSCIRKLKNNEKLPVAEGCLQATLNDLARRWLLLYDLHGEKAFEQIKRNYTLEEKINAVKQIVGGKSYREVARNMMMGTHTTIRSWHIAYLKYGIAGLQYSHSSYITKKIIEEREPMKKRLTKAEREELKSLRERCRLQELEIEYLKKLDALVSKREQEEAKAKKSK